MSCPPAFNIADTVNLHGLYRSIKEALGPKPRTIAPLLDAGGNVLIDNSQQMTRWIQYFTGLYTQNTRVNMDAIRTIPELSVMLDLDITQQLNNNKVAGDDDIPAELLRFGGETLLCHLISLLVESGLSCSIPQQW